jgi:hypothetical protein
MPTSASFARRAAGTALAAAGAAHSAGDVALALAREAELARERAEEVAEFAEEQARGAREYITRVLEPELAEERAKRAALLARGGTGRGGGEDPGAGGVLAPRYASREPAREKGRRFRWPFSRKPLSRKE